LAVRLALVVEIVGTYAVTWRRMRRQDVRWLAAAARGGRAAGFAQQTTSLETRLVAGRLGNAVDRTLRALPTDSRCLVQSLVLTRLLARRGIPNSLVIGAHPGGEFSAHAWVECGGFPVLAPLGYEGSRLLEL
jgi:hypothetical protein